MGPLCSEYMAEKSDRMLFVSKKRTQDRLSDCLNPIGTLTNTSSPPSTLLIAVSCSGSIDLYPKVLMPLSIDCERRVGLTLTGLLHSWYNAMSLYKTWQICIQSMLCRPSCEPFPRQSIKLMTSARLRPFLPSVLRPHVICAYSNYTCGETRSSSID